MLPLDDEGVAYALVALRKIDIIIETSNFSGIYFFSLHVLKQTFAFLEGIITSPFL